MADTSKIRIIKPTHASQVKDSQSPIHIEPHTTNNRTNSKEAGKLLMLKNFQPSKQISSTIVTPKYFKFKQSDKQDKKQEDPSNPNILRSKEKSSNYSQGPSKNAPGQKQSI